jgi:hypothetical protein
MCELLLTKYQRQEQGLAGHRWLMPVIIATQEVEVRCHEDRSSKPAQENSSGDPISKKPITKNGVAQVIECLPSKTSKC